MSNTSFLLPEEKLVSDSFLETGFHIFSIENTSFIEELKDSIVELTCSFLKIEKKGSTSEFLNNFHEFITPDKLNDLRVHLITEINKSSSLRANLYHLAKKTIDTIVGNELCMQRSVNLSIQLPNDESSLLPLHTDVWSGNSPYEVVLWLPLVDCHDTKSMYLLPYKDSQSVINNFKNHSHLNAEQLYLSLKERMVNLKVPFGKAVIFSHSLLHGNRVNKEKESRWSFNVRFKSSLTPYGTKELGETFLPINIKPATRVGFDYKKPVVD